MIDGKCSKRSQKQLIRETIRENDDYSLYRQRSTDGYRQSTIVKVNQQKSW